MADGCMSTRTMFVTASRRARQGTLILGLGVLGVAIVTLGGAFSANVAMRAGKRLQ
ncbi:MAG TPA: hypothetical protein VI320_11045 [Terracidiphilus sp.]